MSHDNSFERQVLDFYGLDKAGNILDSMVTGDVTERAALAQIMLDIGIKDLGISKDEMERQKNILQIELYAQLEKDRNKKPSNNSVDNLTWVEKQNGN